MMEYKGYVGLVQFDDEASTFFGKVVNLSKDGITFEGATVDELRLAFRESVDDYIEWCSTENRPAEKPYSGKFVVRIDPQQHGRAALAAAKLGLSLNKFVEKALADETQLVLN
ncbi:MAG: type II toxin-antitoxin system HicB family antitoxin [Spirochaetales bacterium]